MSKRKAIIIKKRKLNVLLIEPNYKNKYPPIGLMKISSYHKLQGDTVTFFKGDLKELLFDLRFRLCLKTLRRIRIRKKLDKLIPEIENYLKQRHLESLDKIIQFFPNRKAEKVESILRQFAYGVPTNFWDRIYVTTLFTFYWNITIKTIEFAKRLVDDKEKVIVGGIMASLLKEEVHKETGIIPITGLLSSPGILDPGNSIIVDELPLDYSILGEIAYEYPTRSAYFAYMTKGCTRKCAFCSVPKLEPIYKDKVSALGLFETVKNRFGDQRNLMLMDNNVLASPKVSEIVSEIKQMGFTKDAVFIEPNQLDIAIRNLKAGINDKAYLISSWKLIYSIRRRLKGEAKIKYENILSQIGSTDYNDKKLLLRTYRKVKGLYEKHRSKAPSKRYVDFNQGIDARYVTEENMALLSQLPVKPLRIAFDHIGIKKTYINAVELAAKHGIDDLSNYILYNFQDKPEDLYERLRINVELGKRLGITIFSFPMKFVPLFGEESKDRKYVGKFWNKKTLRAVQCILNTTKGIVAPGYDFFKMAFGETLEEFLWLLWIPENYIINRVYFKKNGITQQWKDDFESLDAIEKAEAKEIIKMNEFVDINGLSKNPKILRLLSHYAFLKEDKSLVAKEVKQLRNKFNRLIKKHLFINLTLTYDFDSKFKTKIAV